ncbi:hypothetical protein FRB90_001332 [Tulasnella sp. 427]|nr:hypothetical protein FRB90_001332 [Tulasnella sp. 427]
MRRAILAAAVAALSSVARATFGYTSSGSSYTIDTASSNIFTFTVSSASCDITSLYYHGAEYQYSATASHISSGLGSVSFSITTIGDYIKITCTTDTLTHYMVAHNGDSTIYMATYTTAEPSVGELRFIARLNSALLTTSAYPQSYSGDGTAGAVEGSDVYKDSNGYTYSKFYSSVRHIDDQVHWVSTSDSGVHVSMVMPGNAYEGSSGGPFHRDINSDRTSTAGAHNLYFYMVFSRSGIPDKSLDLSFFSSLSITGYVAASSRGTVKGTATGVSSSYQIVLHWYNSDAQYWVYASSSGSFTSPAMKPGTYTMVLYKNELPVASQSVTVTAGGTTTSNIASTNDPTSTTPTWIIGDFDGKPTSFLNADLQERMHPSDVRMSSWDAVTYTVGSSSTSVFPMAQIKAVNNPATIKFTLTSSQTGAATLRIGSTLAFAGGRPQVTVNSWLGPAPSAPVDLDSRGFTRGTYRGNNVIYEVSIPSGTLVSGTNYIYINVISGSSGDTFLSPNFIYDAKQDNYHYHNIEDIQFHHYQQSQYDDHEDFNEYICKFHRNGCGLWSMWWSQLHRCDYMRVWLYLHVLERLLQRALYGPFIGGKPVAGSGNDIPVEDPATGETLCSVISASTDEVSQTITSAKAAFDSGVWSKAPAIHRSKVLSVLARKLEAKIPEFAEIESLQTGRVIREMKAQLGRLPEWLISIKKIAPALAAGNSVIVKPSELAPISVLQFAELAAEAGVPQDVLSILPGGADVGKAIISNHIVRKVDITAGTATGKAIGSIVGSNLASFTAELGGKAPILIFDDADLGAAVNGVAFAAFVASGQTCVSGTRLLVHSGIYDSFRTAFLKKVESITRRMGNPMNTKSTMGPVISSRALERAERMVSQSDRAVVAGGRRMMGTSELDGFDFSEGYFYPPTVVEGVEAQDELFQEEVFGPVVSLTQFKSEDEAIALANDCKYGLGAGIWTSDLSRAHRLSARIEAGLCWVNTHHRNDPSSPWGGMKESGIGRENGLEAYESYSQSKSTIVNIASAESMRATDDWFAEDGSEKRYALAIAVTSPAAGDIFPPTDSITLKWTSVSSDPTAFRAVMVNPSYSYQQELAAQVNTAEGTTTLAPPSGGFPLGKDFQINLMGTSQSGNPSGILAQSGKFVVGYSSSSSSMLSTQAPTTMSNMATNTAAATATATDASESNVNIQPTGVSAAFSSFQISAGLVASVALLHALAF